jgi:hypothetical protein
MCMVSNIGDGWGGTFPEKFPQFVPYVPSYPSVVIQQGVSQADFDALKKEVLELKKLLRAAADFDKATGQPHCEMEDKVKLIKAIAELVGVDLGDVFGKHTDPSK